MRQSFGPVRNLRAAGATFEASKCRKHFASGRRAHLLKRTRHGPRNEREASFLRQITAATLLQARALNPFPLFPQSGALFPIRLLKRFLNL